jgi:hypothetical protein
MKTKTYLLVYSHNIGSSKDPILSDYYEAFNDLDEAKLAYEQKIRDSKELYSISLCDIIQSTDY